MNKAAIQRFAIWARTELITQVSQRAYQYGITAEGYGEHNAITVGGRALSSDEQKQRKELVEQIRHKGYPQVMEAVAYTWFNRIIALRFMEVNNYLPSHIRVFSDSSGAFKPEILTNVLHLDLPGLNKQKVAEYIENNQTEALYRYLLLTQCNALNESLPRMFERMGGFAELLLPNNILKQDSVLGRMVTDIPEEDWTNQVQIIGWMYQYYNTEPKQAVFDSLKKNVKITKEKIPAATQLFTPDWIVRYMVENSLGRLWLESHPNPTLKANWKYYLDEAEQTPEVAEKLRVLRSQSPVKSPEDIRLIDPCMGSGHILVYAFDVLMQIYESVGVSPRDAAKLILEKNIYGLDIDRRAYQLAYFSLMMKARQYNRRIFTDNVKPQVYHPAGFPDGEEYGSLVKVDVLPPKPVERSGQLSFEDTAYDVQLNAWNFRKLLAQKYDVVVTNPPYMGSSGMGAKMLEFVKNNHPDSKSDLFSAFIERGLDWIKPTGYNCMVTMQSWMFLSSFETMRKKLLSTRTITNLLHMENMVMGIAFGTAVANFFGQRIADYKGQYNYMTMKDIEDDKPTVFPTAHKRNCTSSTENFEKVPGCPVAYWVSEKLINNFNDKKLSAIVNAMKGLDTCDNKKFVRDWHEVSHCKIGFTTASTDQCYDYKWYPYSKGGGHRKWYGFLEKIVDWEKDGKVLRNFRGENGKIKSRPQNTHHYFFDGLTWSTITSYKFSLRVMSNSIFGGGGSALFSDKNKKHSVLALLNSKVAETCLSIINPTLNFLVGDILTIPYIDVSNHSNIKYRVSECIAISKKEYDSFETSWDFTKHPLVRSVPTIVEAFSAWETGCDDRFNQLKANEEELNRIFIDIYGLQDELTPEVEEKDVTARKADLERDIRSLISYAVGCMFGRYSLDIDGLAYAGGEWDNSKYNTFILDDDNIIPICDDDYFNDDITARFITWFEKVYGSDTLEENLKFIADALGGNGTAREVIRNYFLNGFYVDHCKIYKKRPIYWLFDSGNKNGFKALIYMHRYQSDLLARMRTDYVHEQQERYRTQLSHLVEAIEHASPSERTKMSKRQQKIQEQALELQNYEEKIHHFADQNISIDLDDGVTYNYALFADVVTKIK